MAIELIAFVIRKTEKLFPIKDLSRVYRPGIYFLINFPLKAQSLEISSISILFQMRGLLCQLIFGYLALILLNLKSVGLQPWVCSETLPIINTRLRLSCITRICNNKLNIGKDTRLPCLTPKLNLYLVVAGVTELNFLSIK